MPEIINARMMLERKIEPSSRSLCNIVSKIIDKLHFTVSFLGDFSFEKRIYNLKM